MHEKRDLRCQFARFKRKLYTRTNKYRYPLVLIVTGIHVLLVRPIVKTVKEIGAPEEALILPAPEEVESLLPGEEKSALPEPAEMTPRERMVYLVRQDVDKTANIVRTWLRES